MNANKDLHAVADPADAMSDVAKCELCGEAMPPGETMFKYHGFSGPCPRSQHLVAALQAEVERLRRSRDLDKALKENAADELRRLRAELEQAWADKAEERQRIRAILIKAPMGTTDERCQREIARFVCSVDELIMPLPAPPTE